MGPSHLLKRNINKQWTIRKSGENDTKFNKKDRNYNLNSYVF